MAIRNWRPAWNTPGQSEHSSAVLDFTVNRNLTVKGQIKTPISAWTPYTPTVVAYSTTAGRGAASPIQSTGMVYTGSGRWKQIASTVFFYVLIQITTRGTNFISNPYVTIPPVKPLTSFTAQSVIHVLNNTDDSTWNSIFGYAKANAVDMLVGPSSYASPTVLPNLAFPQEFMLSGTYEAVLS
jgi:hypothetical protein